MEDGGDTAAQVERALIRLVRLGRLTSINERIASSEPLDRATYGVLDTVDTYGPLRMSDLAIHQGVDVSTVSRQVATAQQHGLIDRSPDPSDGRATRLVLSPSGLRTLDLYRRERRRLVEAVLSTWEPADREQLVDLLERLNEDLARVSGPQPVASREGRPTDQ